MTKILLTLFFLFSWPCLAKKKVFVVGVHPGLTYPDYQQVNGGHVGIIPSLLGAFSRDQGYSVEYKMVPRKRMDELIEKGEIQIRCLVGKDWVREPENFYWSKGLFQEESTFVRKIETPDLKQFSDLYGRSFAGILGFIYGPEVTKMVELGELERDDVIKVDNLINMVTLKRTDYALESKRVLKNLIKKRKDLALTTLVQGRAIHHCLFSKKIPKTVLESFDKYFTDQKIKEVLGPYELKLDF